MTTYRQVLVTYVDVLAFPGFIERSHSNADHVPEIAGILRPLKTSLTNSPRFKFPKNRAPKRFFEPLAFLTSLLGRHSLSLNTNLLNISIARLLPLLASSSCSPQAPNLHSHRSRRSSPSEYGHIPSPYLQAGLTALRA